MPASGGCLRLRGMFVFICVCEPFKYDGAVILFLKGLLFQASSKLRGKKELKRCEYWSTSSLSADNQILDPDRNVIPHAPNLHTEFERAGLGLCPNF